MEFAVARRGPHTRAVPAQARLSNWDALRWVATADIVALHTTGAHGLFGWGLPLYLVMTCALAARPGRGAGAELRRRVRRLLPPWLWGCVLYGLTRVVDAGLHGQPLLGWFTANQWLYGPKVHLWFLPYACLAGVAVAALSAGMARLSAGAASGVLSVLSCLSVVLAARAPTPWPFSQWVFSSPALVLGLAFGRRMGDGARLPLLACLLAMAGVGALDPASAPVVSRFVGATVLLGLALELPQWQSSFVARFTPALLAVYVLHPWVFAELVHDGLWRLGLGAMGWARAGFTFAASFGLALALPHVARWLGLRRRPAASEPSPAVLGPT